MDVDSLDAGGGKKAIDLATDAGICEETVRLLKRWASSQLTPDQQSFEKNGGGDSSAMTSAVSDTQDDIDVSATTTGRVENDIYRHFEQQLRTV